MPVLYLCPITLYTLLDLPSLPSHLLLPCSNSKTTPPLLCLVQACLGEWTPLCVTFSSVLQDLHISAKAI